MALRVRQQKKAVDGIVLNTPTGMTQFMRSRLVTMPDSSESRTSHRRFCREGGCCHEHGGSTLLVYRVICTDEDAVHWPEEDMGNLSVALNALVRLFRI
jgi:hypothetical protein